jgi:hypothetical protein
VDPVLIDELLKFEQINPSYNDFKATNKIDLDSAIGVQLALRIENTEIINTDNQEYVDDTQLRNTSVGNDFDQPHEPQAQQNHMQDHHVHHQHQQQQQQRFTEHQAEVFNHNDNMNVLSEEMQLRAAYEVQLWKESKEKEFEQYVSLKNYSCLLSKK